MHVHYTLLVMPLASATSNGNFVELEYYKLLTQVLPGRQTSSYNRFKLLSKFTFSNVD